MTNPEAARTAASNILDIFETMIGRANISGSGAARVGASLTQTIFEQFRSALCLIDGGYASRSLSACCE